MEFVPAIVAIAFIAFALVSRRLERTPITGPMLFVALGVILGPQVLDISRSFDQTNLVEVVLTVTLTIVLFTDASAINSSDWKQDALIPGRLLGIGLPLTIVAGWVLALVMLGDLELWEAAVLGTMLAPTDAALGKAVISNPRVPQRIRQALNVESGLNDGIALPVFIVFLEAAKVSEESLAITDFLVELVKEVGIAVAIGILLGWLGAKLLQWASATKMAQHYWLEISIVALALLAYALANPLGGSGFIAAWVAGAVFGRFCVDAEVDTHEFSEAVGDGLTMISFLLFGVFVGPVLESLTWEAFLYGVLSLVLIRVAAVAVSLIGSGLRPASVLYLGWFGPRGLATIILAIAVIDATELEGANLITDAALVTVVLSVVAHGATAWWGSNAYADRVEDMADPDEMVEHEPAPVVRVPRRATP
jgi:NhaP-type Na+/H+ or K+/H+ antiporter